MTTPDEPERWASTERAAVHLNSSRATIYRLLACGSISGAHVGRRRLIDLLSIDRFLEGQAAADRPKDPLPPPIGSTHDGPVAG